MDEPLLAVRLELTPQVADVDVERVGIRPEVVAPHRVEDRGAREDPAGVRHEQPEQLELRARQLHIALAAVTLHRVAVEHEILEGQHAGRAGRAAPPEGAQAGEQLIERERLHQVVVGPRVQTLDPVTDGGPRGEHQDGNPVARRAQSPADLEATEVRKAEIEDDRLIRPRRGELEPARALADGVDLVAGAAQRALERRPDARIVLHHQHTHRRRV